jgi:hypothetical protein
MDEVELAAPDYLDADWIAHNHIPGAGPSDEMLERLCSQPLFQHWRFEEGAPARQAFAYPVMPRTTKECDLVGDVFPGGTCDILIEMADGRIAGFEFDSDTAFQLTGNLIRKLATRLTKRAGLNKKPLPAHLTPYTTKGAWLCCANVLKTAAGTRTEAVIKVRDCTRYAPIFFNITGQLNAIWDELFLFEAYSDPLAQPTGLQLTRLAGVILNGLNDFIHALREYAIQTLTASQFWPTLHNYLTHPDPLIRRNRRQAYELLPLPIAELIMTKDGPYWEGSLWNASRHIDAGHSPYAVFSNAYSVTKKSLRDYSHCPGRTEFQSWLIEKKNIFPIPGYEQLDIRRMFLAFDALSTALRPKTQGEWIIFYDWYRFLDGISRHIGVKAGLARMLREASQIGWARINDWVARKYGIESSTALMNAQDYGKVFINYEAETGTLIDTEAMGGALTLRKLLHGSQLWHRAVTQVTGEYLQVLQMEGSTGECWSWPLPLEIELLGYRIHAICNAKILADEGVTMNHCVSTIAGHCRAGQARVFSLKNTSNNRCSTFDLSFSRDENNGLSIRLREHQGHGNSKPKPEWHKIVTSFVNWLKEPAQWELLADVDELGRIGANVDYLVGTVFADQEMWISIEAVRRCSKTLGFDQYLSLVPPQRVQDQTAPCGRLISITLIAPQPLNQLLLTWMAPYFPDEGGGLRWDIKTPKEALETADSDLDVIVCDYRHDEPATVALARSLMDAGRDVMVLMPIGSDIGRIAKQGIFAVEAGWEDAHIVDSLFITLLYPAVNEGAICIDWADIRVLLREGGIGKFYIGDGENIEKAALDICDQMAKNKQNVWWEIKGALFVMAGLSGHPGFIEQIFMPAAKILQSRVPESASLLMAAPRVPASHGYSHREFQIRAFVVYG